MNDYPKRKRNRLKNYDYSRNGAYFVTICTKDMHKILGKIIKASAFACPEVKLTKLGQCICETIENASRDDTVIDCYVIMPNHIHIIVFIQSNTGERGRSPLQNIVRNIKGYATKQIGCLLWQRSFHDHIVRNEKDYIRLAQYIENNPANWEKDCFYK